MTALMSETLSNKEAVIKALEAELNREVKINKSLKGDYRDEIKELELDQKAV